MRPRRRIAFGLLVTALAGLAALNAIAAGSGANSLGLKRIIAFAYTPSKDFDPKTLRSVTLFGPAKPEDWRYWAPRKVVAGVGHTWYDLLRSPIEKAVENLAGQDFGGNPKPVVMIDEFGFDFGGQMDQKSAEILRLTKARKPELGLAVWQMRGPIPGVLADAYRKYASLVMMESYVPDRAQYWDMAMQAWAARFHGLIGKAIIVLGVGKGGNPGEVWATTPQELEQQIRFVRRIAPDSPGVGFFGGEPDLLAHADGVCAHFSDLPTDGRGLPEDVRALARTFSSRHAKPTLAVSPHYVEPNYKEDGSALVAPRTMRVYLINLGDQDARNVRLRLRNPADKGGDVFAEGLAPLVPKRSPAVGVLNVTGSWKVWVGEWTLEADCPWCDVLSYKR